MNGDTAITVITIALGPSLIKATVDVYRIRSARKTAEARAKEAGK